MASRPWSRMKEEMTPEFVSRAQLALTREISRINSRSGKHRRPLRRTAVVKATRRVETLRARHARYRTIVRAKAKLERCEAAEKVYLERT